MRRRAVALMTLAGQAAALLAISTAVVASSAAPASAADRVVTDGGDSGAPGQLRQVVAAADPGDTIQFTVPTVELLTPVQLLEDLTIQGDSDATTTIRPAASAGDTRLFEIADGVAVAMDHLTLTGGRAAFGGAIASGIDSLLTISSSRLVDNRVMYGGGAILSSGDVTLTGTEVSGNAIEETEGVTATGGAIAVSGNLDVTDSVIRDNTVTAAGSAFGAGIWANGTTTIVGSSVTGNTGTGATVLGGGIFQDDGSISITDSVVRSNEADGGGAVWNQGTAATLERAEVSGNTGRIVAGAIFTGSNLTATNVTFSGNTSDDSSVLSVFTTNLSPPAVATIRNSTIAGNTTAGSKAALNAAGPNSSIRLESTIVGGQAEGANCVGNVVDDGHNLQFGDASCAGVPEGDPLLGPLADNGGPSQTMAITSIESPAVDGGSLCDVATTDQRGVARVGQCDIGAFEFTGPPVVDGDGDGAADDDDNCPTVPNGDQANLDGDALGDACDDDIDGDGVPNGSDAFPTNPGESVDSDGDGTGNDADTDDDNDAIPDAQDGFPLQKDGALSGGLSRTIKANPALAPILAPLRAALLALGL